jgi:hypothetical protein
MDAFYARICGHLMRSSYENRLAMVEATVAFLKKTNNVWQSTPAFVKAVKDLTNLVETIKRASGQQQSLIASDVASKAQARDTLEDTVLEIADQLAALAADRQNIDLATEVEFTRSALDKLFEVELEATAKRISTLATLNLAALADYLVTRDDIADLDMLIADFIKVITAPHTANVERSSLTSSLPDPLTAANRILRERIDKLVSRFRSKQPEFVAGYRSVRVVVALDGHSTEKNMVNHTRSALVI